MSNRLAGSLSPYLLQHKDNPVDWYPWGEEAFAEARRRDVPIFLSIGYSACHWCHVIAHESFEDGQVADLVNANFVPVKVDREEHPDVDALYMRATQALTGQGGWPMTVFATPDGRPYFAGTYYPPEPTGAQPSFTQVVTALAEAWRDRRDEVLASAEGICEQLEQINQLPSTDQMPDVWPVVDAVAADFDLLHGGFGGAPKFPSPLLIDALLVKGEAGTLDMAQRTLEAMARGGIYDQVGGGFHRYSVDAGWVVPHFEKMLDDNALLLGSFARGWRRTAQHDVQLRGLFERVVRGTAGWLQREMLTPGGGFAASQDADSADIRGMAHEGIYYVWTPTLLADALGNSDAEWAGEVFHVTSVGTFEHGLSTLQLRGAPESGRLTDVCERLLAVRQQRFAPPRDDKVLASWNGWAIDGLISASLIFGEREWLDVARRAAEYLWSVHWTTDGLARTSLDGVVGEIPGGAADYGAVALAFGRLAGVLGDQTWLFRAVQLLEQALERFDAGDGFFDAAASALYTRPRDVQDNPTPSGTMSLVAALRLVGALAGRGDFVDRADAAAASTWGTVAANPRSAPAALIDLLIGDEARQGMRPGVAVILDPEGDPLNDSARAVWRMAPAGTAVLNAVPGLAGFGGVVEAASAVSAGLPGELDGPLDAVRPEGAAEYDEHETVALPHPVVVSRGSRLLAPAATVQEARKALWSRV